MTKEKTLYLKNVTKSITAILIYLILPNLQKPILNLFGIDSNIMPSVFKYIYLLAWELLTLALIFMIFHEELEKAWKDLKKNHQKYFKEYFKYWFLLLAIMMLSNLLIASLNGGNIAGNEQTIRDLFVKNPVYIFLSAVLIAPIIEELIFRQGIRNIIPKNNTLFIIVSGLIFGSLHVIGNITSGLDLLYLIPYCTPGFIFAYLLTKTDNILVPASMHFFHNGILMSLQFFILIFA